jgi:hypothetical protein
MSATLRPYLYFTGLERNASANWHGPHSSRRDVIGSSCDARRAGR